MHHTVTIQIDKPPEEVWAALVDVERWPEWTRSIVSIERLDDGPLQVGSAARVKQPRLPAGRWVVTRLEPHRFFDWQTTSSGVTTLAGHRIWPVGAGHAKVLLSLHQTGPLASAVGLVFGRTSRRYVRMEAAGLKRRVERGR
jgi:uncharacterized membrane protein